MTNNTTTELKQAIGPVEVITRRLTCNGCPALKLEKWHEYLENDDSDSGTSANCKAMDGKPITAYWGERDAPPTWCPGAGRSAAQGEPSKAAPTGFDAEFLSKRLCRVAKLAGVSMPDMTHEQIAECAGTLLGTIASKLESKAGSAEQVSERDAVAFADEEMPPLPHTTYNGYADGSEPLYTAEHMHDYAKAFADAAKQQAATIQPEMNMRHIQDSECIQGKCARPTTGCIGKCGLKESKNKVITQPPCANEFVAAGCELFTPSPVAENGDKVLAGIQCVCISANQEYTRCNGIIPDWDLGFFHGQLHVLDQYCNADKSAIAEAKEFIGKLTDAQSAPERKESSDG